MQPHFRHTAIAVAAAGALFFVAIKWGTDAAGGSDSACYLNQARLFEHGTTHIDQPLVLTAPWRRAEWTFTPAGHIPSPVRRDFIVPICPPGLPVAMALMHTLGISALLVIPLTGAVAVWLTFLLGRRLESGRTGAAAAVLLACSPIVLFQVVQPMSDVPAMMWWLLAGLLAIGAPDRPAHPIGAGLATSMAVLTRPNLLPLAFVILGHIASASGPTTREGWRPALRFLLGLLPGVLVLGLLQNAMYGSPAATGYGAPGDLFAASHVSENLRRYGRWLIASHTPILLLAVAAPFTIARRSEAWFGLLLSLATLVVYLPYTVFDEWWYVRFLLPALPWLIVLTVIVIERIARMAMPRRPGVLTAAIVSALAVLWIRNARVGSAFDLVSLERHFRDAGEFAARRLPDRAAVLTVRHSGSVYYYSQRPTVSWDTLDPTGLDDALAFLRSKNLQPVLLLDVAEEPVFRQRFERASLTGRLDWPPIARIGRTVRVYDPADRARYFTGGTVQTIDWPNAARP